MGASATEAIDRTQGLGGSEAAAAVGVDPWKTPVQLYLEKTGQIDKPDISSEPAVHWGTILEEKVAEEFSRQTGLKIRQDNKTHYHPDYSYLRARIDRRVVGEQSLVEIKTTNSFAAKDWGEEWTDEVPARVLLQGAHYLAVLGLDRVYFPVLIGGQDFRIYQADRNEALINRLIERERDFWENHVLAGVPPDPESGADVELLSPWDNGDSVVVDENLREAAQRLAKARDREKTAKKDAERAADEIKTKLGESAYLVDSAGEVLISYKAHTQNRIDTKALERDYPDLVAQYREAKTIRPLKPQRGVETDGESTTFD